MRASPHARRRHRAGARHLCHQLHAGSVAPRRMIRPPTDCGQSRLRRQGTPRGRALEEMVKAAPARSRARGLGTRPAGLTCCLSVADDYAVQVMIHTDTLNESGFVEDTSGVQGPHLHAFHTEGAGGGMRPTSSRSQA